MINNRRRADPPPSLEKLRREHPELRALHKVNADDEGTNLAVGLIFTAVFAMFLRMQAERHPSESLPTWRRHIQTIYHTSLFLGILHFLTRKPAITRPPASRLLAAAEFLCSPQTMRLTVEPLVADWRKEYFDALAQGRTRKARWISIRYYYYFAKAFGLDKAMKVIKVLRTSA